jgi:TonB family protein
MSANGSFASLTTRSAVWLLVIVTFLGTGVVSFFVVNYFSNAPSIAAPAAEARETAPLDTEKPLVGGPLNGKETSLPNPEFPPRAKTQGASGKVTVAVVVDRKGRVTSARALNGHPLLQVAAVAAAKKAKFAPEKLTTRRQAVSGTITYNFKL